MHVTNSFVFATKDIDHPAKAVFVATLREYEIGLIAHPEDLGVTLEQYATVAYELLVILDATTPKNISEQVDTEPVGEDI